MNKQPVENSLPGQFEQPPEPVRTVGVPGAATFDTSDANEKITAEKPNAFWYRVYLSVIVTTVVVIAALWVVKFAFFA